MPSPEFDWDNVSFLQFSFMYLMRVNPLQKLDVAGGFVLATQIFCVGEQQGSRRLVHTYEGEQRGDRGP